MEPQPTSTPPSTRTLDQRWRRTEPFRERLAGGAALGALSGALLAIADSAWARAEVDFATLLLANAGLILPLTVLLGALVALASWFVHPRVPPSLGGLAAALRACGAGRPADLAAFVPLAALGAFAWVTLVAQLARAVLSADVAALPGGFAVAVGSLGLALALGVLVLALTPGLRRWLAVGRSGWGGFVDPVWTLAMALSVVAGLVALGAVTGTVSGDGGLLGIFGVLRRDELDLRAPGGLLVVALAVYLGPAVVRRLRPYQALLIAVLPLALTVRAATALDDAADVASQIERAAPVGKRSLALLRRLTDRDGDGASGWFAGGDCAEGDPSISPLAEEIPDNGIDEDCSGADLSLASLPPPPPPPTTASEVKSQLPEQGNLILITVDTLRYDLGFMGYERPVSKNLDALAARSVVFERAYALASYTGKSVGPMLIGKYGSETHRNWGHFNKFGEEDTFVAERLQRAGVRTIAVHGHRYFGAWGGLERGFDVLDLSAAPPEGAKWATDTTVTSDKLTDAAIAELDKAAGGRFFLWVHYLDPHADYLPHEEFDFGSGARERYDGEVAFTDKHIGRLLDHVAAAGYAGKTSVVVTSDHGEAFGEHKMMRHGFELWEVLVRVPLIVHVPGAPAHRVEARRSLIDLVPTMLEVMGLPVPAHASEAEGDDFVSGVSLVPDVFGDEGRAPARDILIDMPGGPYNEPRQAFIHGDLKLIVSRGAHKELFDLAADPDEARNVWAARKGEIEARYAAAKHALREIKVTGGR